MMRLRYFPANAAYAFTFGDSPTRMGDSDMFFKTRREATAAAIRQGLHVTKAGKVSTMKARPAGGGSVVTFRDIKAAGRIGGLP
jgi:hypothetical protein